ncbi:Predicted PurR-regulated permease PerM [Pseudorhodobacter antarcticus]|jgi:predicted PurR-regulated permease PerM|uniref:Predicted PurR-regulated permease PerM n=1 Tax=Pseudorhodobacter antarcticus TaxID=1077947 RepID=A0A1H8L014_9RHOB|nr:AI-2E family transporter [Pseudorhodobacter antarcticus]SEN98502.1 Predicted PurR-regulated permease PerM [Pseudorhodobacter antarcticus]
MNIERLAQISVIVIGTIALFSALNTLESIFAPLALALMAGVVMSPVTDFGEQRGFPPVIGALTGLTVTLGLLTGLGLVFYPLMAQLVDQAPKVWFDMQDTIRLLKSMLGDLSDMGNSVTAAVSPSTTTPNATANEGVALPSITDALMVAPAIVSQTLIFAGALFFFLLTRTQIYNWAALKLSNPGERAQTALKLRNAERYVARYFGTITLINIALGFCVGTVLQVLGMPGAALWGVVAFLLNFVVYLGPAIIAIALTFAGVAVFDGSMTLAPMGAYLTLNAIEAQFITPTLVGRNMAVNPLLVFLALVFGIWLWGPIGGIVAIPFLIWVLVLNGALLAPKPTTQT